MTDKDINMSASKHDHHNMYDVCDRGCPDANFIRDIVDGVNDYKVSDILERVEILEADKQLEESKEGLLEYLGTNVFLDVDVTMMLSKDFSRATMIRNKLIADAVREMV